MFLRGQEQAILDDDENKGDEAIVEGEEGGIANGKYSQQSSLVILYFLHE